MRTRVNSNPSKNRATPRRALAADLGVAQNLLYPPIRRVLSSLISTTMAPPVHHSFLRRAAGHAWLLGLVLGAGCTSAPPPPPPTRAPFTVEDYADRAPTEIAVLPPSIAPNFGASDGDLLREHVHARLIEKGYTALDSGYVDRAVETEAARGRRTSESSPPRISVLRKLLETDAFLSLDVLNVKVLPGVDPSIYRIEVRATLVDGVTGATLYEHRLAVTYEIDYGENRELSTLQLDDLLRRYAAHLINSLPARSGA